MRETLKHTAFLLLLPVIELISFRLFLHFGLQLKIGFPYTTDFDYFFPGPVGFFLLVYCLEKGAPLRLRLQKKMLSANLLSCFAFLLLNLLLFYVPQVRSGLFWFAWTLNLLVILLTSLAVFVSWRFYFFNKNRASILPALAIVFIFPIYLNTHDYLWKVYSKYSSSAVSWFFSLLWGNAVAFSYTPKGFLAISHPVLSVIVGKGCIGTESLFLFTFIFLTIYALNRVVFSSAFWAWVYFSGVALMFFSNVFRIILLFWTGVGLRNAMGYEWGTWVFKTVAHAQLGWVLYLLTISGFFGLVFYFQTAHDFIWFSWKQQEDALHS